MNTRFLGFMAASVLVGGAASAAGDLQLADLEQAIARAEYPKTTSVLIIRDGNLAYERYFGEGSQELLNNTRSATKFFAGARRRHRRSRHSFGAGYRLCLSVRLEAVSE